MKKLLKVLLSIVTIFILIAVAGMFYITRGLESGGKVEIHDVDLANISDGLYNGQYNAGRWTNRVEVTIRDHKISKISVIKDVTIPKPEWRDQLFNKIIENQNIDIEVISGATVTSKAYLKSIENALKDLK